ncbi:MAG TPA: DNA-binding protein YbiB [Burkholderiales bacterium]|nr:DNA-binding protein YbiB [Burkholderiales bacterium]
MAVLLNRIIKEIGRGPRGSRDLGEGDAYALYAAMLDGEVPDLELGAISLALRIKGESPAELAGFHRAVDERTRRITIEPARGTAVVLPSYNGARKLPNLLPLLALILERASVPVVVHGLVEDYGRVTSAAVFTALGRAPCASLAEAGSELAAGRAVFVPVDLLAPGLARLANLRARLGVRGSPHTLAKLLVPVTGACLRVVSLTHPDYFDRMRTFFAAARGGALLMRGTEGEPVANARKAQAIEWLHDGVAEPVVPAATVADEAPLPDSIDPVVTARWIERALAGETPVPKAITDQAAACLIATGRASGMEAARAAVGSPVRSLADVAA